METGGRHQQEYGREERERESRGGKVKVTKGVEGGGTYF